MPDKFSEKAEPNPRRRQTLPDEWIGAKTGADVASGLTGDQALLPLNKQKIPLGRCPECQGIHGEHRIGCKILMLGSMLLGTQREIYETRQLSRRQARTLQRLFLGFCCVGVLWFLAAVLRDVLT